MSLIFGVIYDPPAATRCALDPDCPRRGFLIDAIQTACNSWHLNCSFHLHRSNEYGVTDGNGTGSGLIGAIQRGDFDASLPLLTPTYDRFAAVEFSEVYGLVDLLLITRAPRITQDGLDWSIFYGFDWRIWTCLLIALGLVSAWITFAIKRSTYFSSSATSDQRPITNTGLSFIDILFLLITYESRLSIKRPVSIQLIICAWLWAILVLGSTYSGVLFSEKLIRPYHLPFTDMETFVQCLERAQCRLITPSISASPIQRLIAMESDYGVRIRKTLASNPMMKIRKSDEFPIAMLRETKQYLVTSGAKESLLAISRQINNCSFYSVDLQANEIRAFAVQKKSKYLPILNKMATVYREHGLDRAVSQSYLGGSTCEDSWKSGLGSASRKKIGTLVSLATAFMFYGLGLFCGLLALALEKMAFRKQQRYTMKD